MNEMLEKEITEKINEAEKSKKGYTLYWYRKFFSMLNKIDIDKNLIIETLNYFTTPEELNNISTKSNMFAFCSAFNKNFYKNIDEFFSYLEDLSVKMGKANFKEFIENSLKQIMSFSEECKNMERPKRPTLTNLFLKCIVLKYPQDVQFSYQKLPVKDLTASSDEGIIKLNIASMEIASISFFEQQGNQPSIWFNDFRTAEGMEQMGLGTHLFKQFCKQIVKDKKGYSVCAWNVVNGHDGDKAYSKWGAYPICISIDNENVIYDISKKSDEEINKIYGDNSKIFYFTPEVIENFANNPNVKYGNQLKELNEDELSL